MIRLGVNIDHVATIRNARGEFFPEPYEAALFAMKSGANSITVHLREDRRHIKDKDLFQIIKNKLIPINLEMAPTTEMLKIALKCKPKFICIVPEKRKEITTEGGLNLNQSNVHIYKNIIKKINNKGIRSSLFINPKIKDIELSKKIGANCIELHTGKFCDTYNKKKNYKFELNKIKTCAKYAKKIGLEVHAGHGLNINTAKLISKIHEIEELNIGHYIIGQSIFSGMKKTILNFKKILR